MPNDAWPLFDLVVRTPRLEIRLPSDPELLVLADVAAAGIHDPGTMPFTNPWTDAEPAVIRRSALQHWWSRRAEWRPHRWTFTGAVFIDGQPVGVQDVAAENFDRLRAVSTGSWLGRAFQGRGLGIEMRAAILHLAFAGLDATVAYSGAFIDNERSRRVSKAFGYEDNGVAVVDRRGRPDRVINLRLERDHWEAVRRADITIEGLEPCLPFFLGPDWD
jgi:RimJ/RimL family protein N-acetyltransferase